MKFYLTLLLLLLVCSFASANEQTTEAKLADQILTFVNKYEADLKIYSESGGFLTEKFDTYIYQIEDTCEVLAGITGFDESKINKSREDHLHRINFLEKRIALISIAASSVRSKKNGFKEINTIMYDYMKVMQPMDKYKIALLTDTLFQQSDTTTKTITKVEPAGSGQPM